MPQPARRPPGPPVTREDEEFDLNFIPEDDEEAGDENASNDTLAGEDANLTDDDDAAMAAELADAVAVSPPAPVKPQPRKLTPPAPQAAKPGVKPAIKPGSKPMAPPPPANNNTIAEKQAPRKVQAPKLARPKLVPAVSEAPAVEAPEGPLTPATPVAAATPVIDAKEVNKLWDTFLGALDHRTMIRVLELPNVDAITDFALCSREDLLAPKGTLNGAQVDEIEKWLNAHGVQLSTVSRQRNSPARARRLKKDAQPPSSGSSLGERRNFRIKRNRLVM